MKRFIALLLIVSCQASIANLFAANSKTQVSQVTEGVTLTDDVDFVITSTEPFTTAGSVDIVNTEHAVVIFENIRPSEVIKSYLKNVYINGRAARNGSTCQVRMYAQGAIVLPYASTIKPLTAYVEPNFEGSQNTSFSLGHTGGYMNNVATSWNNRIRSFRLKRGYMVTFAVGKSGWGYSRCFIADQEDLEVADLPAVLDGKISSYRIFQWYNAQKKGLASSGDKTANAALKTSWCYDWGQGNASLLPDVEWVPNHIYEDWPSSSTCGSVTGSCHMKTNNEPGNSADDHPQDVATVLNNWENLMRTGMRLCSESSHDGSMNHLKAFIDSIDARGWRCDILDLHCYWPSGNFNSLTWYSDNYGKGRPIWISEWIWGASWNHNGAFGSGVNDAQILSETKKLLDILNSNPRVERYAYWNSESKAKIYSGGLTELGKYYAEMKTGLGYNKANEYIPRVVYKAPSALKGTYAESTGIYKLAWTDPNGDMLDSIVVECKLPGEARWKRLDSIEPKDKSSQSDISYTYNAQPEGNGLFTYRIVEFYAGRKFTTNECSINLAKAQYVGELQYGQLTLADTQSTKVSLRATGDTAPYVVFGMVSNKNIANAITNHLISVQPDRFSFRFYPWRLTTPVEFKNAESADYLALPADMTWQLSPDMMLVSASAGSVQGEEVQVAFPQAFPEGVTPVVVAQAVSSSTSQAPATAKVYDITNTGFRCRLVRQEGETSTFQAQTVNYFAATPGQAAIGGGKLLSVGIDTETLVGGTARQNVTFRNTQGETLYFANPIIVAAPQTNNYGKASVFRQHSTASDEQGTYSASIRRQVDATNTTEKSTNSASANGDYVGWFVISDDPNGTGTEPPLVITTSVAQPTSAERGFSVSVRGRAIHAQGANVHVYNASGQRMPLGLPLPKGIYVAGNGRQSMKVQVK